MSTQARHVRDQRALCDCPSSMTMLSWFCDLQSHLDMRLQGMSEDVTISKFFDDPMLLELARQEADMSAQGMGGYGY